MREWDGAWVVVAAFVGMAFLCCCGLPCAAPTPQGGGARAPAAAPAVAWQVTRTTNPMDDSPTVVATAVGSPKLRGQLFSREVEMGIQCRSDRTAVWIDAGITERADGANWRRHPVQVRIGENPPKELLADEGSEPNILFLPQPISLLKQTDGAERILVELTPLDARTQVITFETSGLPEAVAAVREACRW